MLVLVLVLVVLVVLFVLLLLILVIACAGSLLGFYKSRSPLGSCGGSGGPLIFGGRLLCSRFRKTRCALLAQKVPARLIAARRALI